MAKTIKHTKILLDIEQLKGYYSHLFYMMNVLSTPINMWHHCIAYYTHVYGALYTIFVFILVDHLKPTSSRGGSSFSVRGGGGEI